MEVPEHDLGVIDVVKFANLAITLLNNKVYFPYHDNIFISMDFKVLFCQAYYLKCFLFPFSFVEKREGKFCRPRACQPLAVGGAAKPQHHH